MGLFQLWLSERTSPRWGHWGTFPVAKEKTAVPCSQAVPCGILGWSTLPALLTTHVVSFPLPSHLETRPDLKEPDPLEDLCEDRPSVAVEAEAPRETGPWGCACERLETRVTRQAGDNGSQGPAARGCMCPKCETLSIVNLRHSNQSYLQAPPRWERPNEVGVYLFTKHGEILGTSSLVQPPKFPQKKALPVHGV